MPNLIIFEEKKVTAQGLNPNNKINEKKLKEYFFEDDYKNLSSLNNIRIPLEKKNISLLYPGCGADIFFPLIYLEKLFPKIKKVQLNFVDYEDNLGLIKTVLDNVGISFSEKKNKIKFYWGNILVKLDFITKRIEDHLPKQKHFDVYFERAFRIMRDEIKDYEKDILAKLKPGGILISDSGFEQAKLKEIEVPKKLSSYGEMIVGVKDSILG